MAASRSQPGILWTHNDSGDGPRLYATNLAGDHLGLYELEGVAAVDWEDIAIGPCPPSTDEEWCLYIADTGDNFENREHVEIHVLPEPTVGTSSEPHTAGPVHSLRASYSDRPRDAESIAVAPSGDLYLITKGRTPPIIVYLIPQAEIATARTVATVLDTLPIDASRGIFSQVTAAAISPSGALLAVRTYTQLHFFEIEEGLATAGPPCNIGLRQPQGEAVDFLGEETLVLTSETALGREGGISRVKCGIAR